MVLEQINELFSSKIVMNSQYACRANSVIIGDFKAGEKAIEISSKIPQSTHGA